MPTGQESPVEPDWADNAPKGLVRVRPLAAGPTVSYSGVTAGHTTTGEPDALFPPKPRRTQKPKRGIRVPRGATIKLEEYKAHEARIVLEPPAIAGNPPPSGRKKWYGSGIVVESEPVELGADDLIPARFVDQEVNGHSDRSPDGEPYDAHERASERFADDFDDRPLWERQAGLPAG